MVTSIEDIIKLHKSEGNIEDAYVRIHIDDKILNLNTFTMRITPIEASIADAKLWNERISLELHKYKKLEKEVKEFVVLFELLNKMKIRSGKIEKSESPDFIIKRNNKTVGIEITKIYVGYDWMLEKIANDIKEYRLDKKDIEGYIEYKKAGDKIEISESNGKITLSPRLFPKMNEEYNITIKNKIFEKIRKQLDDYEKYDINVIFAEITSPEYFDDVTDLELFTREIMYYIAHLEANLNEESEYKLIININNKWIEIDMKEGSYRIL